MLRRSGASSYSRDHIKFIFCPSAWKREIDEVLSMVCRGLRGRPPPSSSPPLCSLSLTLSCSAAIRSSDVDRFITLNRICARCIRVHMSVCLCVTEVLCAHGDMYECVHTCVCATSGLNLGQFYRKFGLNIESVSFINFIRIRECERGTRNERNR